MTVSWNITVSFWTATAACGILCSLASCLFFICLYPFPRNMHRTAFRDLRHPLRRPRRQAVCWGFYVSPAGDCVWIPFSSALQPVSCLPLQQLTYLHCRSRIAGQALFFLAICNAAAFSAAEEGVTLAGRVIGFAAAVMPFVIPVFLPAPWVPAI